MALVAVSRQASKEIAAKATRFARGSPAKAKPNDLVKTEVSSSAPAMRSNRLSLDPREDPPCHLGKRGGHLGCLAVDRCGGADGILDHQARGARPRCKGLGGILPQTRVTTAYLAELQSLLHMMPAMSDEMLQSLARSSKPVSRRRNRPPPVPSTPAFPAFSCKRTATLERPPKISSCRTNPVGPQNAPLPMPSRA